MDRFNLVESGSIITIIHRSNTRRIELEFEIWTCLMLLTELMFREEKEEQIFECKQDWINHYLILFSVARNVLTNRQEKSVSSCVINYLTLTPNPTKHHQECRIEEPESNG